MNSDIKFYVGKIFEKEDFLKEVDAFRRRYSHIIGLDGLIDSESFRLTDPSRKPQILYFDHHGVDGSHKPASCKQIYSFAFDEGGLDRMDESSRILAAANHADEDVFTGYFILKHFEELRDGPTMHLINLKYFVDAEDRIDRSFATQLAKTQEMNGYLSWVFGPYHSLRYSGKIFSSSETDLKELTDEVLGRLLIYTRGKAKQATLDDRFTRKKEFGEFAEYLEHGPGSRSAILEKGGKAGLSHLVGGDFTDKRGVGRIKGSILWRRPGSDYFDIERAALAFNAAEIEKRVLVGVFRHDMLEKDKVSGLWGGSDDFLACPRDGTVLTRDEIFEIAKPYVKRRF